MTKPNTSLVFFFPLLKHIQRDLEFKNKKILETKKEYPSNYNNSSFPNIPGIKVVTFLP